MRRCVEYRKRLWPWGTGLESPYGWMHMRCLDKRLRREGQAILQDFLQAIIHNFRVRSGTDGGKSKPPQMIPPSEKIH
jgi:hypothetical protein